MAYLLHINTPTKTAIAHPPDCPEASELRTEPTNQNYWREFAAAQETDDALRQFREQGYESRWCQCIRCCQTSTYFG